MESASCSTICDVDESEASKLITAMDIVESTTMQEETVTNLRNTEENLETKMEFENADVQNENSGVMHEYFNPPLEVCNMKKHNIGKDDERDDASIDVPFSTMGSTISSEPTTSQDNTPTSSNGNECSTSHSDHSKDEGNTSKGKVNGDSGISMERSSNSSDEDSTRKQKSKESTSGRSKQEPETTAENTPKFHKLKSKVKKRNYRKKNSAGDAGDANNEAGGEDSELGQETDDSTGTSERDNQDYWETESQMDVIDGQYEEDDPNEWTTANEEEVDMLACLKKEKPKSDWFVVPELLNREIGNNPLFRQKYCGSLHVVEHLELMYKLEEHQGCINALYFNQKGNLLASGSDDFAVVIWDWAVGKKLYSFDTGHRSNVFQAKWLPLDVEYLMATCARDGQVRLLDLRRGISRKIATHNAPTHKLAVHPDIPHVIISVGEDAKVLSIDIRENKPTKLLVVNDSISDVPLYSVHSNPFKSNEFCVGGRSECVRIYDRRKVSTPVCELCPEHLSVKKHAHVTCAVYNYNGTEVLASYNDEDIYLFDTVTPETGEFAHRYQGHRNSVTVKGVNFFGPKSQFIVSGSDCGNIFIWEKNTEAIVQWMPADEQGVVNCLEPHPHIPILATSGLDYDVKIWIPSREVAPAMKNLESCVKSNSVGRLLDNANERDEYDNQMLWILLRHIRHTERSLNVRRSARNRNQDDDVDDDNLDDSSNENDSSDHSDSQSEGDGIGGLQCPPS